MKLSELLLENLGIPFQNRDKLGENSGMFFDSIDNGFWMKDVDIPLEIQEVDTDNISNTKHRCVV